MGCSREMLTGNGAALTNPAAESAARNKQRRRVTLRRAAAASKPTPALQGISILVKGSSLGSDCFTFCRAPLHCLARPAGRLDGDAIAMRGPEQHFIHSFIHSHAMPCEAIP